MIESGVSFLLDAIYKQKTVLEHPPAYQSSDQYKVHKANLLNIE